MTPHKKFEREFLKLATTWMSCRFRIINGDRLIGCKIPFDIPFDMVGCNDSANELRLLCREVQDGV